MSAHCHLTELTVTMCTYLELACWKTGKPPNDGMTSSMSGCVLMKLSVWSEIVVESLEHV